MADFPLGLSFDDVLLLPRLSAILPGDADISSQLVPGFDMKIPVLSAAMDTVSESELAIALAREGGLAVIHRNNPIDIQAAMVSRVKRFENAVIPNPVTVNKDMTLEEVHQIMMDQGYSGFPVVDANRKLEGIITGRDMRGVDDYQNVRVKDVMTPLARLITAAPTTTIEEARHILYTHRIEKLPLVDEHGVLAGLITETDIQKRAMFADASKDEHGHLRCGAAVDRSQLQPGDLIFFHDDNYSTSPASHCGIYVGNDQFVHASTYGSGGLLTALNGNPYYSAHYIAARRMG